MIPFSERKEILDRIHDGHLGVSKWRERARDSVWWPGINQEIKNRVARCRHCLEKQNSQRSEPLIPTPLPERAFQKVGVDLLDFEGTDYLACTDYYSRYIDIVQLPQITSKAVVSALKSVFTRHGVPEVVTSDNGTQFTSQEFRKFTKEWNFIHETSSPHFPQANGKAENGVKIAKAILRQEDPLLAILMYRTTLIVELGASPAELAFGRKLCTTLPCLARNLDPSPVDPQTLRKRDAVAKQKQTVL